MGRGKSKRNQNRPVAPDPAPPPKPEPAATCAPQPTLLSEVDVCSNGHDEPYIWQRRWFQILLAGVLIYIVLRHVIPGAFQALHTVSSILIPVTVGLSLAYIVNPLLRVAGREAGIGRLAGTVSAMLISLMLVALFIITAVPLMAEQGKNLIERVQGMPAQVSAVLDEFEDHRRKREQARLRAAQATQDTPTDSATPAQAPVQTPAQITGQITGQIPPDLTDPTDSADQAPGSPEPSTAQAIPAANTRTTGDEQEAQDGQENQEDVSAAKSDTLAIRAVDWVMQNERARPLLESAVSQLKEVDGSSLTNMARKSLGFSVGLVGTAVSFTSYIALGTVIVVFTFFFFSWKFDAILAWFEPFIPAQSRDHTLAILHKMDLAVSSFVRGRLIQSLVMTGVLTLGWWIGGVPFWFLLGIITGALNVVPFLPAVGAAVAILLTVCSPADPDIGFVWSWGLLLWPAGVFVLAQTLDGYVIEPIVQGKATNLDPLSVMLAVLVGGTLAGVLGMLLAIPLAACIKILMQEMVLPMARSIAADN